MFQGAKTKHNQSNGSRESPPRSRKEVEGGSRTLGVQGCLPPFGILTGSHNLALMEPVTQSLAGRTALLRLLPLARSEVLRFQNPPLQLDEALLTGGHPRIFDRALDPSDWLASYVATYIERDVRTIANVGDLVAFQRFMQLCAGRTGQLLNYSSLAADCGVSQPTAKARLSVLETSFVVYGGDETQRRSDGALIGWHELHASVQPRGES